MELPDTIEAMTPAQLQHFEMLIDQYDEKYPVPLEVCEERLAKDPTLAILPSGRKVSTADIIEFNSAEIPADTPNSLHSARVHYRDGRTVTLRGAEDVAAFNSALNDIGVYVNAPTLKGDDADGDGKVGEAGTHFQPGDCFR